MLISLADLDEMGNSVLAEFRQEVAQLAPSETADFLRQVERLEAKLERLYAVAASAAQREERIEGVAGIWSQMVAICDQSAQAVSEISRKYNVQDLAGYDRILDIRNECEENRVLHA